MSPSRYAIYFAPEAESLLGTLGAAILGRCATSGHQRPQPQLPGIASERLAELTASPRHYGLHATLKPPFFLAAETSEKELLAAVQELATRTQPFFLPNLELDCIGSFLAMVPADFCPALYQLAEDCLINLDHFRHAPSPEELERRRAKELTPKQEQLLGRYGYPYVLDEYRFHLTLTGRIVDPLEREAIRSGLTNLLIPVLGQPVQVRELCVFYQPDPKKAFRILERMGLG